jgi:glycosyltransferase involved in cell wall biosynthesis
MRVVLLSYNARAHDAVGNYLAETAAFFHERGAAVRLLVQCPEHLHPDLRTIARTVEVVETSGPVWDEIAGADLVIAQYPQAYELLHFLPLLAGYKPRLLLDYHGVTPPELWSGPNREALEQGQRLRGMVWCADEAIAHSEFNRQELAAATGFPAERIHRLPLVVDRERFRPGTSRSLHRRLGLGDGTALLLYVGRLAANKRVPVLVEALAHLESDVHAVVVGDVGDLYATEAQGCRQLARERGVAERLHLLGPVGDGELVEAYRSADVLVLPSRHEGFCVPVIEAMACGLPVVAARSTALPETVGDAGLTFTPDDSADLARVVACCLRRRECQSGRSRSDEVEDSVRRRIAIVCFRFGAVVVGGAETSLRTITRALQDAGHFVDVFTTCTRSETDWSNQLPPGTATEGGLRVHRFPIDPHDRDAHHEAVRAVVEADGRVTPEQEEHYLRHSVHSAALLAALRERAATFDAIITGPYLFGLTADVARAHPDRTLVLPCFHDEPIARLATWPRVYGGAGGFLLHSPEEKELLVTRLGINHPTAVEIGTWLETTKARPHPAARPYVVYCGRYSRQKNLPLLIDWMGRYQRERPGRLDLVLVGQGEVPLPREPWLHDLGRVGEDRKRAVIAGARALVQLSWQESLSIVALEAWAQGVPVIAHARCAVLAGQIRRSDGGMVVADFAAFRRGVEELVDSPECGRQHGRSGLAYVEAHYASRDAFLHRISSAIDDLLIPLRQRMRRQGLERAARFDRPAWREALGRIVENLLDAGPRPYHPAIEVQPLCEHLAAEPAARTTLVPVRVRNLGSHAAVADGPGQTALVAEVRDVHSGERIGERRSTDLPGILMPGASQTAMMLVPIPPQPGSYDLVLAAESRVGGQPLTAPPAHIQFEVGCGAPATSAIAPLLDGVREALLLAHQAQRLPDDYVDVTEGWFARWKRWAKWKLLNNFKRAYVDVLSRQQSRVNVQLVVAVQQLAECCATLEHAVRTMQGRELRLRTEDKEQRTDHNPATL